MFEKYQKKLINFMIFFDLPKMKKSLPQDYSKLVKIQNRRIRALMKAAYKQPFYKERFDKAGVKPSDIRCAEDLAKLPLLTKDELRAWMKELAKDPKYDEWYHDTTSGSSGEPLMLLMSPREKACLMANWFRVLLVAGYDPFRGKTMSRKSAHSVTGGKDTILQRIGILRRYFLDQYAPETEMIRQVNECQPDFLYMNKTELMRMCMYAAKNNIKVWQPKLFCPTGEKIDDAARSVFFKVLGTNMIDSYGTAEAGACMVKLPGMDAHKIWHDSYVVNIHDDEGNLALEGKLACTPLFKKDLPLINYVVGDKVVSEFRDGERFITGVQGRLNDAFKYETGEVTTFFEIAPIIAHCSDLIQIRFIQEDYHNVTVQAVFNEKESARTIEEVEADLRAQLEAKFKHPFNITFEWKDNLPPDDNGKLRMIVSKVK